MEEILLAWTLVLCLLLNIFVAIDTHVWLKVYDRYYGYYGDVPTFPLSGFYMAAKMWREGLR